MSAVRSNLSAAHYQLLISTVAKIPCEPARPAFLAKFWELLPAKGKVSDRQIIDVVNSALQSFQPGQWQGDAQGAYPPITEDLSLKEAATLYERFIHQRGAWAWPPFPPISPEEAKAKAESFAALSPEQRGEAYARTLYETEEDYQAAKAAEEKRRQAEQTADATPWPVPSPPTTRTIRGEIEDVHEEPEPPIVPLSERAQPRQRSIYGQELARRRGELPEDMSDEERAEALNEQLERERLQRRRLQGKPPVFFR
jgi:hypothetical protein